MDTIISTIVPAGTVTAEMFGDMAPAALFPEEAAIVRHAVAKRQREFEAGRWVARQALQRLGYAPCPILAGPNREPIWPDGVVGSITHCSGYSAAAVAPGDAVLTVGIDAEPNAPLPEGVLPVIALDDERAWMLAQPADGTFWDRLLFSAKESVFKGWFPLTHRWLDFAAVQVRFDTLRKTFRASLGDARFTYGNVEVKGFDGHYVVHCGLVLTAVALLRPRSARDDHTVDDHRR